MYMALLPECMFVIMLMPGLHGGQKRAWDPLELQVKKTVNHHVGAEGGAQVL